MHQFSSHHGSRRRYAIDAQRESIDVAHHDAFPAGTGTADTASQSSPGTNTFPAGFPTFFVLKGGIPRSSLAWDFLLTPSAPSFIECTDDPHHPPFSQSARKGRG